MCGSVILHMETIYIRLHAQNIKTVSSCPHYHTSTRKTANYKILNKIPSLAPHKKILILYSPAHTMRFSSFVGRRDDEKTKIAWCERTKDDRRLLILPTRQLLDRFENRIGPTAVAWCERVKDSRRINRAITDQSQ